ncbi:MAG: hypothetical protein OEO79_06675 [Gemmatimonadota bacterium]|nr:hypothetical protein [Gemmatimonadota bacterium]MDH3423387.1 hypothetical protein [Gemmatimonadota bacterium]
MKSLETVLGEKKLELVHTLVRDDTFGIDNAERFIALAGPELIKAIEWQLPDVATKSLVARSTIRDVLSAMNADRIASTLGIPSSEAWTGLRTLVPHVLHLAEETADAA